jgi:hypothetical protein
LIEERRNATGSWTVGRNTHDRYCRRQTALRSRGRLSQVGRVGREQNPQFWRCTTDRKRAAEAGQIDGYFAQSRRLYPRRFTPRGFASSIEWGDT